MAKKKAAKKTSETVADQQESDVAVIESPEEQGTTEQSSEIEQTSEQSEEPLQNGHNFSDPGVEDARVSLAELMKRFDDYGVQIVEEQWRQLSREDQEISVKWLADRRIQIARPVPTCLFHYAAPHLQSEAAPYFDEQRQIRRVIMPCKFGKHSETKPDGDDSEPKIKMSVHVPIADLSPGTADQLFGCKNVRIEFSRRAVNTWNQNELPGASETFSCVTDIVAYSRNRTHWKFGFFISMGEITIEQAYDLWKMMGSCRIEPLGEAKDKSKRDESENPDNEMGDEDEPDEVSSPSLFDVEDDKPVEYLVPVKHPGASCTLLVWRRGDRFQASSDLMFTDRNGTDQDFGAGDSFEWIGDGCVSEQAAIEKEIGTLIDEAMNEGDAPDELVAELKDYLGYITGGGKPQLMPEESPDPSF